eukprot:COSAG01_NODE_30836_length_608_cov_1.907662_1_plen_45_part_01
MREKLLRSTRDLFIPIGILGSIGKTIVVDCLGNTVDPRTLYSVRN